MDLGWTGETRKTADFLGAVDEAAGPRDEAAEPRGVLFGAPLDFTATFRPGSRFAPRRIREASDVLEEFSLELGEDLADHPFIDIGDVILPYGNVSGALEAIRRVAVRVVERNRIPFVIGGEHLVTWPVVQALTARYPDLIVLHFDAHADLRQDYVGERLSHATALRLVAEELGPGRVYQFGVRSATAAEAAYARDHTRFFPGRVLEPLAGSLAELGDRPLYVTIDIDVVDPAFAPGTGTPEPGGISAREMLAAVHLLRGKRVVGLDLVEVSPAADPSERTAVLGAKIIRDAILSFC